jgi:hypothetical protein
MKIKRSGVLDTPQQVNQTQQPIPVRKLYRMDNNKDQRNKGYSFFDYEQTLVKIVNTSTYTVAASAASAGDAKDFLKNVRKNLAKFLRKYDGA